LRVNLFVRSCAAMATTTVLLLASSGVCLAATLRGASTSTQATAATAWLAAELTRSGGSMPGFTAGRPDVGLTEDVVLALTAGGAGEGTPARTATAQIAKHVADFVSYDSLGAAFAGVRLAGPMAKSMLVAEVQGGDPKAFGGWDLEGMLRSLMLTTGPTKGRFADKNAFSADASNGFGQALALMALQRTKDGVPADAVSFLLAQQCPAGGFRLFYDSGASCAADAETDTDATSLAVEALQVVDQTAAVKAAAARAVAWLLGHQDATTGSLSGTGPTATPNSNSTGLAAAALRAVGAAAAATKAAGYVAALQLGSGPDAGAIGYDHDAVVAASGGTIDDTSRDQWRRSTAQAVLALGLPGYGAIVAVPAPVTGGGGGGGGGGVTGGTSTATASSSAVEAGGTIRIAGSGFRPGERVQVWLHSTPVLVASGYASGAGTVSLVVRIPAGTKAGAHQVVVLGVASGHRAVAGLRIAAVPVPVRAAAAPESGGPTLPDTGRSVTWPAGIGALLLLVGAALVAVGRSSAGVRR
jgi:LPXTG-motif cell wall-anchored protein